jgi:hypothetical protein
MGKNPKSHLTAYCDKHLKENTKWSPGGRFEVRLPFVGNLKDPRDTAKLALARLKSVERRWSTNLKFVNDFINFILEFIEVGHMEQIYS